MKKILAGLAASTLLLVVAAPALADDDLRVFNKARVRNYVSTRANSGYNRVKASDDVYRGFIKTGTASATSDTLNDVNYTEVGDCGCYDDVTVFNRAYVRNSVRTSANTGGNSIRAYDDVHGGMIMSGGATSRAVVDNLVNTTVVGGE